MNQFTHLTGQYLQRGDAQIYFETAGNPDGQPLVLLHGGLGNMTDLNVFLNQLSPQFKLIGIDFRGHGKSTLGSAPSSYALYQADVEAVLNHLNISSFGILGFSDGGIVGYRMAAKDPTKILFLITLGAQWRIDAYDPTFSMLGGLTSDMWLEMFPEAVKYYENTNPKPDFDALVKAVVNHVWTDTQATGYPHETVKDIKALMLIIRGDNDHLLSLNEAAELRNRVEGAGLLNIPYAGHAAYEDSAVIFIEAINNFLMNPRKK